MSKMPVMMGAAVLAFACGVAAAGQRSTAPTCAAVKGTKPAMVLVLWPDGRLIEAPAAGHPCVQKGK